MLNCTGFWLFMIFIVTLVGFLLVISLPSFF